MATHTVFCSACDRNVSIEPRSAGWTWRIALSPDAAGEVACFDHGVRCTGALCPLLAVAPERGAPAMKGHGGARPPS
jgi:hypothetical protein